MIIKDGTRLYVNITNACDVTCPFCCMYSGNKNDSFMDFDTFKSIVDECEGDIELQLEGGEPTQHRLLMLFVQYAVSKPNMKKIILLTNGISTIDPSNRAYGTMLKHLVLIARENKHIEFEVKISINSYIINSIIANNKWMSSDRVFSSYNYTIFSTEDISNFNIRFNVRLDKSDYDEIIKDMILKYEIAKYCDVYYLQSYGRLSGNEKYDDIVIKQNIVNWRIYACTGKCFDQDLKARSEYELSIGAYAPSKIDD